VAVNLTALTEELVRALSNGFVRHRRQLGPQAGSPARAYWARAAAVRRHAQLSRLFRVAINAIAASPQAISIVIETT
jgi:hypothetical protein